MKRNSDSTYLISGKYYVVDLLTFEILGDVIGLALVDNEFEEISFVQLGWLGDTVHYPAPLKSIDYTNKDNIYFGGTSNVDEDNISVIHGELNSWFTLSKVDSTLSKKWERSYGGDTYYMMFGLMATIDGGCVMYGVKHDYENNPNVLQLYILKVDGNGDLITSTTIPIADIGIEVYPNPFNEQLTIKLPEVVLSLSNDLSIEITDIQGRTVYQEQVHNQSTSINLSSSLSSGVYIISLEMNNRVITKRKIVKH